MQAIDQLSQVLKQHGMSITQPRQIVFAAFQQHESVTMRELTARAAGIDRASVYRTVALFEKLGIVQRLQMGWKYKLELSDVFQAHHHHATCTRCGRSIVIPENADIEVLLRQISRQHHFTLQSHQLELRGYCADCKPAGD